MANLTEDFIASSTLNEKLCFGKAWPTPRLSQAHTNEDDTYEVVVVGAGPAGLLLTLELARLGLNDHSLICIDAKDEGTKTGHADGVNARSQEILRTLGLEADILRDGNAFSELAIWGPSEQDPTQLETKDRRNTLHFPPFRFDALRTIHQGRIERILKSDLQSYSARGVQYSTSIQKVWLDKNNKAEYPVLATLEHAGSTKTIRTKYLVGADGAHSVVRKCMNIEMNGDTTDHVWGVIDFVVDSNFPDIRRPTNIEGLGAGRGDGVLIPRERLSNGSYVTRLYIDMTQYNENGEIVTKDQETALEHPTTDLKAAIKARKAEITVRAILEKGAKTMKQFRLRMKEGTQPFWWASYSVGQRLADNFIVNDSRGTPRIFLAGDGKFLYSDPILRSRTCSRNQTNNTSMSHALPSARPRHEHLHARLPQPRLEARLRHLGTDAQRIRPSSDIRGRAPTHRIQGRLLRQAMEPIRYPTRADGQRSERPDPQCRGRVRLEHDRGEESRGSGPSNHLSHQRNGIRGRHPSRGATTAQCASATLRRQQYVGYTRRPLGQW